jgi:pSer/pThr/pTyr-binding forkhead associated (FHA) protein
MSEFIVKDVNGAQRVPLIGRMMVGRSPNGNLVLRSPYASRRHAWIWQRGDQVIIEDLGSTHGTYVNGQRLVSPRQLRHNDVISIGGAQLVFVAQSGPRASRPVQPVLEAAVATSYPITPPEPVVARPFPATHVRSQRSSRREVWIVILLLAIMAVSLLTTASVLLVYTLTMG